MQHPIPFTKHARFALGLCLALATSACGDASLESDSKLGSVQMALTALGSDGDTYRIRGAHLHLDGPSTAVVSLDEAYGDAPLFSARVDVGSYSITLEEGWYLERDSGEGFARVDAEMVSDNPMQVEVEANETSVVAIIFESVDAEVEFATGDLEVWLGVNHLDCEHGEYITRSCGANLTGRQFRMCEQGWWRDWSECSAHCDQGYCLFKDPETFDAATVDAETLYLDFESYASGSLVPEAYFYTLPGHIYSDEVSFASVGASNQMVPEGSDTPFIGQKRDFILGYGGHEWTEAGIRSSAGPGNYSGFDGIEAILAEGTKTLAMAFEVDQNLAGFHIEVHDIDCAIVASIPVSPGFGTHFIVIGDKEAPGIEAASSVILSPSPSDGFFGTEAWTLNAFSFAR